MKYYVYALSSLQKNYIYVGISDNPIRRIQQHNLGYNKTTKHYKLFRVILIERHNNRIEARQREKYLKSSSGKRFLRSLIKK